MASLIGTTPELDVAQDTHTTFHPDTPVALVDRRGPPAGFDGYELVEEHRTRTYSLRPRHAVAIPLARLLVTTLRRAYVRPP